MTKLENNVKESIEYIRLKTNLIPEVGLVLGTGLGHVADEIEEAVRIPYGDIPNFKKSTFKVHKGQLVIGKLKGRNVICMQGRVHFYEGYTLKEITYPIRVMKTLGVDKIIITNASGGINKLYVPGDFVLIEDHINLLGNPLAGQNEDSYGVRFPEMSEVYDLEYREKIHEVVKSIGIELRKGVYAYIVTAPSFETPAEIRFLSAIGADIVGMSTVPEVIVAKHCEMRIVGISLITNMAAGVIAKEIKDTEIYDVISNSKDNFSRIIHKVLEII